MMYRRSRWLEQHVKRLNFMFWFDVDAAQAALSAAVRSEQEAPGESRPLRFTPLMADP